MRDYRRAHLRQPAKAPIREYSGGLAQLLERAKNNLAFDLTSCAAKVWLISSDDVKNLVATAELILVEALSGIE